MNDDLTLSRQKPAGMQSYTFQLHFWKIMRTIVVGVAAVVTIFPFLWMLMMSLKIHKDALTIPPQFIFLPTFKNYIVVLSKFEFLRGILNSFIISVSTIFVSVFFGMLAAYAISRFRFAGSRTILYGMLFTRVFPPISMVIPYYLIIRSVGLYDTYVSLVLAYLSINIPLVTWLIKGYIDSLPQEIEHCAMIDGCSRFQTIVKISLPLIAPGIVATGIFSLFVSWNNFIFPLILSSKRAKTLPVYIAEYVGTTGIAWPQIMAASVIALIPVIVFTYIVQHKLVQGLSAGAVKG
jgi:multiple sugar transport system permease protein